MPVEMIGSAPPERTHGHGSDISAVRACASDGHVWVWRRRIRHGDLPHYSWLLVVNTGNY